MRSTGSLFYPFTTDNAYMRHGRYSLKIFHNKSTVALKNPIKISNCRAIITLSVYVVSCPYILMVTEGNARLESSKKYGHGEWKSAGVVTFRWHHELSGSESSAKTMEERVAMSETAIYKLQKFISSGEPSVKLLF